MTDKEFWEKCGFEYLHHSYADRAIYATPDGSTWIEERDFPPVDLNNLFKYAVPKLTDPDIQFFQLDNGSWEVSIEYKSIHLTGADKDPAIALKKAIEQVWEER